MTFYFYDLETSGFSAKNDRIMQFAGQRTDMDLKPIGEPDNILVKLTDDILPSPEAILVTEITPQKTSTDGISEAEFCKYFMDELAISGTVFVGYNNLRFDNDFMRFTLWRNFYDAYEWCWKNDTSTWDLLDVVRMTRALRPAGINWPFASDGKPSNKLELITSVNKLSHEDAHDALSDVNATIAVARLIKAKQPKLFDYLFNLRNKRQVEALVNAGEPLIYTSGRYSGDFEKTTIAVRIANLPDKNVALMYDLRIDPDQYLGKSPADLAALWQTRGIDAEYFPIKKLAYNHCPALAPLVVLDKSSETRLKLHKEIINNHLEKLSNQQDLGDRLIAAYEITQKPYQQELVVDQQNVDASLYSGFINEADKIKSRVVRAADQDTLADLTLDFNDDRLKLLLPLYKARNFPKSLIAEEWEEWEKYKQVKLAKQAPEYFKRLSELSASVGSDKEKLFLLEELRVWGESILPEV